MHEFRRLVSSGSPFQFHKMTSFLSFSLQNAAMLSGDAAGCDAVSEDQHHPVPHPQVLHKQLQSAKLQTHAQLLPSLAVHQDKQPTWNLTGQASSPSSSAGGNRGSPTPTPKAQEPSMPLDPRLQKQSRSPIPKRPRRVPSTGPQASFPAPAPLSHGQAPLSPQEKTGSGPSQARSRRSPSPVSMAQRQILPALPNEPLPIPANDARQFYPLHSERSEAVPSRSPSPKRQRQSRPCPDDCAHADSGIARAVLQAPGLPPRDPLNLPVSPQHHLKAPSHAHPHSLEAPSQTPEEPPEGPSPALADALKARPPKPEASSVGRSLTPEESLKDPSSPVEQPSSPQAVCSTGDEWSFRPSSGVSEGPTDEAGMSILVDIALYILTHVQIKMPGIHSEYVCACAHVFYAESHPVVLCPSTGT